MAVAARQPEAVFDWEQVVREDPRPRQIDALVQKILAKNFPEPALELPPRFRNAPSIIPQSAMPAPAAAAAAPESSPSPSEREFVNVRDYQSESASDHTPIQEVDPMDELSDFEQPSGRAPPPRRPALEPTPVAAAQDVTMATEAPPPLPPPSLPPSPPQEEPKTNGGDYDMADTSVGADEEEQVEGEADGGEDDEEHAPTACVVCNRDDNDDQTLICDGCEKEYHLYCLNPPLQTVPTGDWFCPDCRPQVPASAATAAVVTPTAAAPPAVKAESATPPVAAPVSASTSTPASAPVSAASTATSAAQPVISSGLSIKQEQSQPFTSTQVSQPPATPQLSIVESLEQDAERSNQLLIHACQCDDQQCRHAHFQYICPHMKRFLRSACWASHSETWRTYRVATVTAELFAYHALRCQVPSCSVPMCEQLRAEEYV